MATSTTNTSILMIEDCQQWQSLFQRQLRRIVPKLEVVIPTSLEEARQALAARQYGALLLDQSLSDWGDFKTTVWDLEQEILRQIAGGARALCTSSNRIGQQEMVQRFGAVPTTAWTKNRLSEPIEQERLEGLLGIAVK